ncbi:TetR/AcrR family transcriptional regulator [Actinomadura nitritigenes]|uniref:TetR/AcrR family transcriptional regulator n=1 Tax=Actinomadura nitritigenes TaxID=134602 RepID=UPI003D919492
MPTDPSRAAADVLPPYKAARRTQILAAAARLLEQQPFEQIQMRDVADAADVAMGTLYRYFRSKELLYVHVLEMWARWESPEDREGGLAPAAAVERLRSKVHLVMDSVERRPNFFALEVTLRTSTDPDVRAKRQAWSDTGAAWLVQDLGVLGADRARRLGVVTWAVISDVLQRATINGEPFAEARATVDELLALLAAPLRQAETRP